MILKATKTWKIATYSMTILALTAGKNTLGQYLWKDLEAAV